MIWIRIWRYFNKDIIRIKKRTIRKIWWINWYASLNGTSWKTKFSQTLIWTKYQRLILLNHGRDSMVVGFITTDVVSSNLDQVEVYNIMWSSLSVTYTGRWFSPGTPVSPTNKTYFHNITEMLLKVALNTIKQRPNVITCTAITPWHYSL